MNNHNLINSKLEELSEDTKKELLDEANSFIKAYEEAPNQFSTLSLTDIEKLLIDSKRILGYVENALEVETTFKKDVLNSAEEILQLATQAPSQEKGTLLELATRIKDIVQKGSKKDSNKIVEQITTAIKNAKEEIYSHFILKALDDILEKLFNTRHFENNTQKQLSMKLSELPTLHSHHPKTQFSNDMDQTVIEQQSENSKNLQSL